MNLTVKFSNVYVQATGVVVGQKEGDGPLKGQFDKVHKNCYAGEKTFEDGEVKMAKEAIGIAINKAKLKKGELGVMLGGDLSNQIAVSSYVSKNLPVSFLGIYGACATSMLGIGLGAMMVDNGYTGTALAYTSSNFAAAERQFRYPNEYGMQKKDTVTTTATGAAAIIVSTTKTKVKITSCTFGKTEDPNLKDLNDMGSPMAFAAYSTIKNHLKNMKESLDDYDLILTGDLSEIGTKVLKACFNHEGITLTNHEDAGKILFYREKEEVYAGGSGTSCIALVGYGYIINQIAKGLLKKVLFVATGALFSPTFSQQKHTIPVIAHAIVMEGVK